MAIQLWCSGGAAAVQWCPQVKARVTCSEKIKFVPHYLFGQLVYFFVERVGDGDEPDSEMDDCFEKSKGRGTEVLMDAPNSAQGYRCHNNVFQSLKLLTLQITGALVRDSGHRIMQSPFAARLKQT